MLHGVEGHLPEEEEEAVADRDLIKALIVEFIGPFALVFAGVGAIIATQGGNLVAIALAHGLAIGLMVTAVGHVSGGHFNPAVTVAMLVTGRIQAVPAAAYIGVQILGAVVAAGVLVLIYPDLGEVGRNNPGINNGVPAINPEASLLGAFVLEVVLTFFLVWVIFGTAVDWRTPKAVTGLAIGLTITMDIFAGGAISGAVMNPARALGPAIVQGDFTNILLWIVAPIVGGALAALLYQYVLLADVPAPVELQEAQATQAEPINDPNAVAPAATARRRRSRRR
jgi:aquaporin Z